MLQRSFHIYKESFRGLSRDIWLLSLVMLINRSGTMVLPFLTVFLSQVKGYSFSQVGWVMSCFGAGSVLGAFLGGKLTDRLGYYKVQVFSLLTSGVGFIVLGYMEDIVAFCIAIFLVSMLADMFRPANFAAVAAYSKPENRTRALTLIRLAVNLGFAVGPAVGGLIAASAGYDWLFWLDGLTCISAAGFMVLSLPEKQLPVATTVVQKGAILADIPLISPYRDRHYLLFILLVLINGIAFMQLFSTWPVYLKQELLLDESHIGRLMALNGLLIALFEMPLIYMVEKKLTKQQVIGAGTVLIGIAYLTFNLFGPFAAVALLSTLFITIGEMLSLPFIAAMAIDFSQDERSRGEYMAVFTMTYSVSHIIAPNLGMQLAGWAGFEALWYVMLAFALIASAGFISFKLKAALPKAASHDKTIPEVSEEELEEVLGI
ncbi:MAG TPA: MFS transporter [Saprospiraceae bacterium]|nr:MFS transporter [Saprospiraceae bacterium]HMQ83406.1 MFS transporter [Saprospiraceae bacterium]